MFKLLKQEIVQKVYFLLLLIIPVLCRGIILYNSFGKDIVVLVESELAENLSLDSDSIDIEEIYVLPILSFYQSPSDFLFTNPTFHNFLLHIYNICSEQTQPPP